MTLIMSNIFSSSLGFNSYFLSLKPHLNSHQCPSARNDVNQSNVNCRNIWFSEFWEQRHKCKFEWRNSSKCTGDEDLLKGYEQEGLVPFVIDAVYAFAHALDDIINTKCGANGGDCWKSLLPISGHEMLKFIRSTSFKGPQGTEIRFNEDGDALGYYNIYQYQRNDTKYDYIQIGTWRERLVILKLNIAVRFNDWRDLFMKQLRFELSIAEMAGRRAEIRLQ